MIERSKDSIRFKKELKWLLFALMSLFLIQFGSSLFFFKKLPPKPQYLIKPTVFHSIKNMKVAIHTRVFPYFNTLGSASYSGEAIFFPPTNTKSDWSIKTNYINKKDIELCIEQNCEEIQIYLDFKTKLGKYKKETRFFGLIKKSPPPKESFYILSLYQKTNLNFQALVMRHDPSI